MDTEFINKGMETMNNLSKLAANVTTPKAPKQENKEENTSMPHNQLVEVKVGNQDEARKPIILKEKPETHIHKVFPDNRELSDRECDIEKLRLTNEHELKMAELKFRMQEEEALRAERKEREEYARREREKRQEADRKFFRRLGICCGGAAVIGLGAAAYDFYTHSRNHKGFRISLGKPDGIKLTTEEGTVE